MKNKSLMLLVVAAGCGLVAMIGVQQVLSRGKPTAKTRILVARTEIEAGIQLDQTNVAFKEMPNEAIPEGAITSEADYVERALKHRIGPGQPIVASELGNKGEFGLEIKIPAEMRVVSCPVTATMTHSGLLRPGNYVDVSAVIETTLKGGGKRTEVKPVLQCVQVFAVGSRIVGTEESKDPKANEVKNVSFLVYPLQGQLLQLAYKQSNGNLQFALRSGSDKTLANARDLSDESLTMLSNSLMGNPETTAPTPAKTADKPAAVAKPQSAFRSYLAPETPTAVTAVGKQAVRRTWKIEIFQGDQREVQEIDWPDEASSTGATKGWSNPLMKLFDRNKKPGSSSAVETQSTSLKKSESDEDAVEDRKDDETKSVE